VNERDWLQELTEALGEDERPRPHAQPDPEPVVRPSRETPIQAERSQPEPSPIEPAAQLAPSVDTARLEQMIDGLSRQLDHVLASLDTLEQAVRARRWKF
jgi:hypothetical protein